MTTTLADALPDAPFWEGRSLDIDGSLDEVWAALINARWSDLRLTTPLMLLRSFGTSLADRDRRLLEHGPVRLMRTDPPHYAGAAQIGRPWQLRPEPGPVLDTLQAVADFNEPEWLKYGMDFTLEALTSGSTRITTTTLCEPTDGLAFRRFWPYWALIRPFSGLIRRDMLQAIARGVRREASRDSTRAYVSGSFPERTRGVGVVHNAHRRLLSVSVEDAGDLLDSLASPDDRLWPFEYWPPMRLDRPLRHGARGGHGPIRYHVEAYTPGLRVRFHFDAPTGFDGYHEYVVDPAPDGQAILTHTLNMRTTGRARLSWPMLYRPLHDALLTDSLSKAAGETGGASDWTWRVRALRALARQAQLRRPRSQPK